jgi:hypothetical protein
MWAKLQSSLSYWSVIVYGDMESEKMLLHHESPFADEQKTINYFVIHSEYCENVIAFLYIYELWVGEVGAKWHPLIKPRLHGDELFLLRA